MREKLSVIQTHAMDFWLARASVVAVIVLQVLIINRISVGPRWLGPLLEAALLLPLSVVTAWTQRRSSQATTDEHWDGVAQLWRFLRFFAVLLTAVVTLLNLGALLLLVEALLKGNSGASGKTLLLDAVNLWVTNVIAFALWYWSIDRGGPASRDLTTNEVTDFLFPQMAPHAVKGMADWSPGFVDYLFVSFTNAAAFSPTDTLPLTQRAKLLMMSQAAISIMTLAIVASRAVNILA
jgi:hypothetical protein